jgi:hypothetical protein
VIGASRINETADNVREVLIWMLILGVGYEEQRQCASCRNFAAAIQFISYSCFVGK